MRFKVRFGGRNEYPVQMGSRTIGIRQLDQIRKEAGVANLSPHLVKDLICEEWDSPSIEISEMIARVSGHFGNQSQIRVKVPNGGLNRFMRDCVVAVATPKDGSIQLARIEQCLDEDALSNAWIAAGYPLEWDPEVTTDPASEGFARCTIPQRGD